MNLRKREAADPPLRRIDLLSAACQLRQVTAGMKDRDDHDLIVLDSIADAVWEAPQSPVPKAIYVGR